VSADDDKVCPILGGSGISDHYVFVRINDVSYDISIDGSGEFQGAAAANGGDKISGKNIELGLTHDNKLYPVIWYVEWDVGQDFSAIGRLQTSSNTYRLFGQLQEIVLLPQVPTLEQRQETEGYLAGKWRLRSKLPADHLFKEAPVLDAGTPSQTSKVSGVVLIDEIPVERTVRAFSYDSVGHIIDGGEVTLSRSLGHSNSDPGTGEYTIDLLAGYGSDVFVVAFDDYGDPFTPEQTLNVGDRIHPTTPNGHVLECTGAGSLPAEEPAWIVDTETAQLYGSASMIARVFYRPMVQGPIEPKVTVTIQGDEFFDSVALLLHMDGEDGGSIITDSSLQPKMLTSQGATTVEFPAKFDQSVRVQSGSRIECEGFPLDSTEFTIEAHLYFLSGTRPNSQQCFISQFQGQSISANQSYFIAFRANSASEPPNQINMDWRTPSLGYFSAEEPVFSFIFNTWHHFAITRKSGFIRTFVDGTMINEEAVPSTHNESSETIWIGDLNIPLDRRFNGHIEDLRITNGVARYTADFTPPNSPFPDELPPAPETDPA
jgi:hypothetical protein